MDIMHVSKRLISRCSMAFTSPAMAHALMRTDISGLWDALMTL